MLFAGALVLQYPVGWISDRMDRRKLIMGLAFFGTVASLFGWATEQKAEILMLLAFFTGGVTTPLYALILAYTNDSLPAEDMPAASGGLIFTFGLGAIFGPMVAGGMMELLGAKGFWVALFVSFSMIVVYALYRMTQRSALPMGQTESYLNIVPSVSPVAVEAATEWSVDQADSD